MGKRFIVTPIAGMERAGRPLKDAVKEVWRLLKQGIDMPGEWQAPLSAELRELAAPHMAVLVHKRAKLVQALQDERWASELADFVGRIVWPHLHESEHLAGRSQNCVAELLDEIVAAEQRAVARIVPVPQTSRFDTSWAT
ncbi:MAG TPA: hypothetical protein VHU87_12970 [Rhizomicrobium sp.]|jgi:hypothetical protein|nr:hypothetical protein [Rhizomicrobium sp.]